MFSYIVSDVSIYFNVICKYVKFNPLVIDKH